MGHSKWNYIAVGANVMGALLGALTHSAFLLILCAVFAVLNWYIGEHTRQEEKVKIILEYQLCKKENSDE